MSNTPRKNKTLCKTTPIQKTSSANDEYTDIQFFMRKKPKIFDDDKLNTFICDGICHNNEALINAIVYITNNTLCFVDSSWYLLTPTTNENENSCQNTIYSFVWINSPSSVWKIYAAKYVNAKICQSMKQLFFEVSYYISLQNELKTVVKNKYLKNIKEFVDYITSKDKMDEIMMLLESKFKKYGKFDGNMDLFAFTNGIYDFKEMIFRNIDSSDMITINCGYDYKSEYTDKQKLIDTLSVYFKTKEMMQNVLTYIVCALSGQNQSNLLMVLQCPNLCYRRDLLNLLQSTFNNYCFNVNNFSALNDSSKNNDKYIQPNIRFLFSNSLGTMSQDLFHQLVTTRRLQYQNKTINNIIDINFTTICLCEKKEIIDKSYENDIITIKTSDCKNKFDGINKNDFFLLLLEYLQIYKSSNIIINKKLFERTLMSYSEKLCDEFVDDCLEINNGRVKCVDVFNKYLEWFKNKNYDVQITKFDLFSKLRKYSTYKKSLRFNDDNIYTSGFEGFTILTHPRERKNETYIIKKKETEIVEYLKHILPNEKFIYNKVVKIQTTGKIYMPDIRYDCKKFNLIIEVDEHAHKSSSYNNDMQRMYDITDELDTPCLFIRYNPDNKNSNKEDLSDKIKAYLKIRDLVDCDDGNIHDFIDFDPERNIKIEYLFYGK